MSSPKRVAIITGAAAGIGRAIASRLALVVKSGKYSLGYKSALKHMRNGKGEQRFVSTLSPGTGA